MITSTAPVNELSYQNIPVQPPCPPPPSIATQAQPAKNFLNQQIRSWINAPFYDVPTTVKKK